MATSLYLLQHSFCWQQIPKGNISFHSLIFLPSVISVYGGNWTFISVFPWELRWRAASANHPNSSLFPVLLRDLPAYVTLWRMHSRPVQSVCPSVWCLSLPWCDQAGVEPPKGIVGTVGFHKHQHKHKVAGKEDKVAGEESGCPQRQRRGSTILIASSGS